MFTNTMWVMAAEVQAYQVVILGFGTVFVGLLCLIAIIGLMGKIMAGSTRDRGAGGRSSGGAGGSSKHDRRHGRRHRHRYGQGCHRHPDSLCKKS